MVIFHSYVNVYQRVSSICQSCPLVHIPDFSNVLLGLEEEEVQGAARRYTCYTDTTGDSWATPLWNTVEVQLMRIIPFLSIFINFYDWKSHVYPFLSISMIEHDCKYRNNWDQRWSFALKYQVLLSHFVVRIRRQTLWGLDPSESLSENGKSGNSWEPYHPYLFWNYSIPSGNLT